MASHCHGVGSTGGVVTIIFMFIVKPWLCIVHGPLTEVCISMLAASLLDLMRSCFLCAVLAASHVVHVLRS
jgi:hypothetical protein